MTNLRTGLLCLVCFILGYLTHTLIATYVVPLLEPVAETETEVQYPLLPEGAINDLRSKP